MSCRHAMPGCPCWSRLSTKQNARHNQIWTDGTECLHPPSCIDVVGVRLSEGASHCNHKRTLRLSSSPNTPAHRVTTILRQYLSGYAPARAAGMLFWCRSPIYAGAAGCASCCSDSRRARSAVSGRWFPRDIFCCHIRLIVGLKSRVSVCRDDWVNQLHPFFLDGQVEFVHVRHRFIMHFLQVGFLSGKYHHAEYAPDAIHRRPIETSFPFL